tara:strand:+ start:3028 stop:3132 length:105 start_codon:yes stop_codon:yes gene_type:complete
LHEYIKTAFKVYEIEEEIYFDTPGIDASRVEKRI